jgi:hypothetical protein
MEIGSRDPFRRIFRMEVERLPLECGAELTPYLLRGLLTEAAPRSDVVRPDEDFVLRHASD